MSDIQAGTTLSDGVSYHGSDFNALVNNATILPAFITAKGAVIPSSSDSICIYDSSGSGLAKCTLGDLISNVIPQDNVAGIASLRTLGTGPQQAAAGSDSRFPASVTGLRKSAGSASTDTAAAPKDLDFTPQSLSGISNIDWDLGNLFYEGLLGTSKTYTFSNVRSGRVIIAQINQNGHTVSFQGGWILLGTQNVAGWNVYCFMNTPVGNLITVAN